MKKLEYLLYWLEKNRREAIRTLCADDKTTEMLVNLVIKACRTFPKDAEAIYETLDEPTPPTNSSMCLLELPVSLQAEIISYVDAKSFRTLCTTNRGVRAALIVPEITDKLYSDQLRRVQQRIGSSALSLSQLMDYRTKVKNYWKLTCGKNVQLSAQQTPDIVSILQNVRSADLGISADFDMHQSRNLPRFLEGCTNTIEQLKISRSFGRVGEVLTPDEAVLEFPKLTDLAFSGAPEDIVRFFRAPNLKSLEIVNMRVSGKLTDLLSYHGPIVSSLTLGGVQTEPLFASSFILRAPRLTSLRIVKRTPFKIQIDNVPR
eukprot:GHVO01050838.1.p1 GENE.GHVO01050838.1~~GHVO01050838.1.p1  ORF type:complete len:318 (+),score=11.56 GHVO01050838.1:17-970(+)